MSEQKKPEEKVQVLNKESQNKEKDQTKTSEQTPEQIINEGLRTAKTAKDVSDVLAKAGVEVSDEFARKFTKRLDKVRADEQWLLNVEGDHKGDQQFNEGWYKLLGIPDLLED